MLAKITRTFEKMGKPQDALLIQERLLPYLKKEIGNASIDYSTSITRLHGGFETRIFQFQLKNAPLELSQPLALRLYPQSQGARNAVWESTIQNGLVKEGYPAAKVHFICKDLAVLDGAFIIMDLLPGKVLSTCPQERMPELWGKAHASLHALQPENVIQDLKDNGFDEHNTSVRRYDQWYRDSADRLPWLSEVIDWLFKFQPPSEQSALCHGDFHMNNLLYQDDTITGVVDWGGFAVGDPLYDVANSIILITVVIKHLATVSFNLPNVDWDDVADRYVMTYQESQKIDNAHLDYYKVQRCVRSLIEGNEGHKVWQLPLIVKDICTIIHKTTGIEITVPE